MTIDETRLDMGEDYVQLEDLAKRVIFRLEGEQLAQAINAGEVKPGDLHQSLFDLYTRLSTPSQPERTFVENLAQQGVIWE